MSSYSQRAGASSAAAMPAGPPRAVSESLGNHEFATVHVAITGQAALLPAERLQMSNRNRKERRRPTAALHMARLRKLEGSGEQVRFHKIAASQGIIRRWTFRNDIYLSLRPT